MTQPALCLSVKIAWEKQHDRYYSCLMGVFQLNCFDFQAVAVDFVGVFVVVAVLVCVCVAVAVSVVSVADVVSVSFVAFV